MFFQETARSSLHHGGAFFLGRSFDGTMVEWHRHRGVSPDFTMVKKFLHHGVFSRNRKELTPPWWRFFFLGRSFDGTMVEWHRHRGVSPDFTMVKKILHHGAFSRNRKELTPPWWSFFSWGGVLTAPRWSFYGTMVEWHRHRGVSPDFTMVKKFLHHAVFSRNRKELTPPWWRFFFLGRSFHGIMVEWERCHRGVSPDFTLVKNLLHHGVFSKSCRGVLLAFIAIYHQFVGFCQSVP